jgi:hypothetical protein
MPSLMDAAGRRDRAMLAERDLDAHIAVDAEISALRARLAVAETVRDAARAKSTADLAAKSIAEAMELASAAECDEQRVRADAAEAELAQARTAIDMEMGAYNCGD